MVSILICVRAEWPSEFIRRMFGIFTVKLQFIVPFVIVSICYMKISMALGTRVRNMSKSRTSRKDEMERERKRKTNRMLIAMVAIFGISWLPMNLVNFISDLYKPAESWPYFQVRVRRQLEMFYCNLQTNVLICLPQFMHMQEYKLERHDFLMMLMDEPTIIFPCT